MAESPLIFGSGSAAAAQAVAIQPDGKIVAAGFRLGEGGRRFALARYENDGSLDATFGTGGKVITAFPVTVNDTEGPTVTSSVATPLLWPPNHDLVNVGLSATVTDNCPGPLTLQIRVVGNEDDDLPTGNGTFSPDAANVGLGTLRLRAERQQNGAGRVYLIIVKTTDASGNAGVGVNSVVVPRSASQADIDPVNAPAAAAKALAIANNGNPPSGYFVIGDGPIIGPKQ